MKRRTLKAAKLLGIVLFFLLVLFFSTYYTMKFLIKGEELPAPDFKGLSLTQALQEAEKHNIYLKKVTGNYGKQYKPQTVINQSPMQGIRIKERSFVRVFVTSDAVEVEVPTLVGGSLADADKLLRENDLRKRYVTYMDVEDIPVDQVLAQSIPSGSRTPAESEMDLLVSKGPRSRSYIMPDIIGKRADYATAQFNKIGLRISEIVKKQYPGLSAGLVIGQYPEPGFEISPRERITLRVSE